MIIKRLFELLWKQGVVLVTTSNRKPDDLYLNGIQRKSFLPFIPLLGQHCQVFKVESLLDYRKFLIEQERAYFQRLYHEGRLDSPGETLYQSYFVWKNEKHRDAYQYVFKYQNLRVALKYFKDKEIRIG